MTRYTITFTDQPGAKARYRTALKLMGAGNIRIVEAEESAAPKLRKDNTPTSEEAKAIAALFGRTPETEWADAEIALFVKARKTGSFTPENMKLITEYYRKERAKGREGIHRRDLKTFLANASGELDRARALPGVSRKGEWLDSTPKLVALPDPEESERIAAQARAGLAKFREAL